MIPVLLLLFTLQVVVVTAIGADFQQKIAARDPQGGSAAQSLLLCNIVGSLLDVCNTAAARTSQANCLCYSSSLWVPTIFDNAVATCADYASTALAKDAYSLALSYGGFCTKVGDINAKLVPSTPTPTPSPTPPVIIPTPTPPAIIPTPTPVVPVISTTPIVDPTPAPSPTTTPAPIVSSTATLNIFTNPGCSWISFALSYCNSATPGFTNIAVASQAPCLCYSSTAWSPNTFDGAAKTCADYVKTAEPSFYTDIVEIQGFCTSVGDVLANNPSKTTAVGGGGGIGISLLGLGVTKQSTSTGSPLVISSAKSQSPARAPTPVTTTSSLSEAVTQVASIHYILALLSVALSLAYAM